MSNGDALIFRAGLDLKSLEADLKSAQKMVQNSAFQKSSNFQRTGSASGSSGSRGGGGHGEGGHGGGMMNKRAVGDVLDAVTGQRGWVMKMQLLQAALPLAAVGGLAIGLAKASEKFDELVAASEKAREALAKPLTSVVAAGGSSTAAYVAGLKKAKEELHAANSGGHGVLASIGSMLHQGAAKAGNTLTGSNAFDDRNQVVIAKEREKALDQRAVDAAIALKQLTKDQIAERQQAFEAGGKELELVTARQKMEKDIAAIQASGQGTETNSAQIDERRAAFDMESQEIERKAAATDRELDLEHAILSAKMIGRDVAVAEAQARLDAANEEVRITAGRGAENGAAVNKRDAAALALRDAQRQTGGHRAQLSIASAMAAYRAPAEEKQLETLRRETAELQRQLQPLGEQDSKREGIAAKIEENHAKEREMQRAHDARVHARADTLIDATTGEGQGEQAKAITRKLAEATRYQAQIANNPEVSQDEKAGAAASVNRLTKQQNEMVRSRAKSLRDAQAEVDVMTQQLERHAAVAEALRTQHEFEDKILQARRDGNKELASALQKQQQLALAMQIQTLGRKIDDRSKGTLEGLAAHAFNQTGAQARKALRLDKRAEIERDRGHFDKAKELFKQSDAIKSNIGALKDGDKEFALLQQQLDALNSIDGHIQKGPTVRQ